MYIYKNHIDNYIKCPYLFGMNVLKDSGEAPSSVNQVFEKLNKTRNILKNIPSPHKKSIATVRDHVAEIASYEMKNQDKLSLSDYRVKYTNKHYAKQQEIFNTSDIVKKLNGVFEIFATNMFLGYNVPVEIAIQGTSIIYRDIVDFILTDSESNITIVEFDDLSNFDMYKKKLRYWSHYIAPYGRLAESFEKAVNVVIIDPDDYARVTVRVHEKQFEDSISQDLYKLIRPINDIPLTRNLNACNSCELSEGCC